jgi:chromosome segregation ATPase
MRLLQLKINGLERTVSFSAALTGAPPPPSAPATRHSDEEYSQLQGRLAALLNSEGQILRSELLDTHKLTGIVKEMGVKLQELEDMSQELQLERAAREDLQRRLNQHTLGAQVEQASRAAVDHQVSRLQIELLKAQEAHKKAEHEYQIQSEVGAGSKAALEEQVTSLQRDLIAAKDELALTKTRLAQQSDAAAKAAAISSELLKLQAENSALKDHLINTQKDSFAAREELKSAQESMQADYSAMWTSVQELSKLDALKDQSIQDLIMDRDKAVFERDGAMERFAAAKSESSQLLQDLQVIIIYLFLNRVEGGPYDHNCGFILLLLQQ